MMQPMTGNQYRTTVVCVDSYDRRIPEGRLYNPALQDGAEFHGVMDFLLQVEKLLDGMNCPQSFTARRSFRPGETVATVTPAEAGHSSKLATFNLRVLFRQNASWQGSVSWLEGKSEESFRSALELLFLLDSACTGE